MRVKVRSILGLFTLAVCAPFALAQGTTGSQTQPPPPPAQQGQMQGPNSRGMGPQGQMGPRGAMMGGGQMMNRRMNWRNHRRFARRAFRRRMAMRRRFMARREMGMGMPPGGGFGFGGGRGMGMRPGMGRMGGMGLGGIVNNPSMREKLGITDAQAAKINQQDTDFQKEGIQNRATVEMKHVELNQLMSADTPDRGAIDKKLQEISAAQLAADQANAHHMLDMKSALTPDQQAKLKELMQSGGPGMGPGGPGGRGGRGGRGGGPPQNPPASQPGI